LSAKVFASYDYSDGQNISALAGSVFGVNQISGVGEAQFNAIENENTQLDVTVNYVKEWGSFKLDLLGGYSYQEFDRNGFFSIGRGFTTNNLSNIFDDVESQFNIVSDAIGQDFQQFGYDDDSATFRTLKASTYLQVRLEQMVLHFLEKMRPMDSSHLVPLLGNYMKKILLAITFQHLNYV